MKVINIIIISLILSNSLSSQVPIFTNNCDGYEYVISPDGKYFAIIDWEYDLGTTVTIYNINENIEVNKIKVDFRGINLDFSQNSKLLYFTDQNTDACILYFLDTKQIKKIKGSGILYSLNNKIYAMDLNFSNNNPKFTIFDENFNKIKQQNGFFITFVEADKYIWVSCSYCHSDSYANGVRINLSYISSSKNIDSFEIKAKKTKFDSYATTYHNDTLFFFSDKGEIFLYSFKNGNVIKSATYPTNSVGYEKGVQIKKYNNQLVLVWSSYGEHYTYSLNDNTTRKIQMLNNKLIKYVDIYNNKKNVELILKDNTICNIANNNTIINAQKLLFFDNNIVTKSKKTICIYKINDFICNFDTTQVNIQELSEKTNILKVPNILVFVKNKKFENFRNVEFVINKKEYNTNEQGYTQTSILQSGKYEIVINYFKSAKHKKNNDAKYSYNFTRYIDADSLYSFDIVLDKTKKTKVKVETSDLETPVYEFAISTNTIPTYNEFLARFPNAKYAEEIKEKKQLIIDKIREEAFYKYIKKEYKLACCLNYLDLFPNGKHMSSVENIKEELQLYQSIVTNPTIDNCLKYLSDYYNGKFTNEISEIKTDIELFKKVQNGDAYDCDIYLSKYPKGKYVSQVQNLKEKYFLTKIQKWNMQDCNNYLAEYPKGKYINEVNKRIEQIEQALKAEHERKQENLLFNKAIHGRIADCNTYLSTYPNGSFLTEVKYRKENLLHNEKNKKREENEITVSKSDYNDFSINCARGNFDEVKEYINSNKQIEPYPSWQLLSGLTSACFGNNYDIAKYLIDNGANVSYSVNYKGGGSIMTPLYTSLINHTEIPNMKLVRLLLDAGANPNIKLGKEKTTIFTFLNHYDKLDCKIIGLLFENGFNPNYIINIDSHEFTPLASLIMKDEYTNAKCLIKHGALTNIGFKYKGKTHSLLDLAYSENCSSSMINMLKSYGVTSYKDNTEKKSYLTVGAVIDVFSGFMDDGSYTDEPVENYKPNKCWDEENISVNATLECCEVEYYKYQIENCNGKIKEFYYFPHIEDCPFISTCNQEEGYWESIDFDWDNYLGKNREQALKKLCGCN